MVFGGVSVSRVDASRVRIETHRRGSIVCSARRSRRPMTTQARVSRPEATPVEPLKRKEGKRPFEGGICTSITAPTPQEARRQVQEAQQKRANLLEFRLDCLRDFQPSHDLENLLKTAEIPYIVTYRPTWEGGRYEGDEQRRLSVLKDAAEMGAPFVDIELKAAEAFFSSDPDRSAGTEFILSHHDFEGTPASDELVALMQRMRDSGADIVKIATTAQNITDCHRLLMALDQQTTPAIVIGMGERGLMTRVLAPKYGGFLTFAALSPGEESAPGQPTIEALRNMYHVHDIKPLTKVYGVVGKPIAHSKSPLFHNACFQATGRDAVFLPLLVDDFQHFMETFTNPDFAGYSVTIPHKEAALKAAQEIDEVASGIGACNTLIRAETGTFAGFNTDCFAAMDIIEAALKEMDALNGTLRGKTMVVVGAGGVSKALVFGGISRGARVIVANRTIEKAQRLAEGINNCSVTSLEDLQSGKVKGDVLANGTSLGMEPHEDTTPVHQDALRNFKLVFDAVYTPRETRLLREAAEVGCQTASGVGMFVGQAQKQFELFTGKQVPSEVYALFDS